MASLSMLDPRALAMIQVFRRVDARLNVSLKVMGIEGGAAAALKTTTKGKRGALKKQVVRLGEKARTMEEYVDSLDILQMAYIVKNGPEADAIAKVCGDNGKRWYDNAINDSLKR